MRIDDRPGRAAEEAVMRLVRDHAAELLRVARRFSYCADDAHDAYQRALEILVKRMRADPPQQPLPWLRTVVRHEALLVRAQRGQLVGREEVDFERHEGRQQEDPAERIVQEEQLRHTAEALHRLKPQEVTALALRAEGLSYKEICERTGWTYTRCNRAITEGRRALLDRLGAIDSGAECERWTPLISLLADGEATAAELAELRPHLRSCPACRATLRRFHAAPAQVAALVPPLLVPLAAVHGGDSAIGQAGAALHALADRVTRVALRAHGAFEAAPGAKLAAVAASTAALAGGGAVIEHANRPAQASTRVPMAVIAPASAPTSFSAIGASPSLPSASHRVKRPRERSGEFAPPAHSEFVGPGAALEEFAATEPTASSASAAPTAPPASPASLPAAEFAGP